MSEKKVVNRKVAIALGLVCIILLVSLIVVVATGAAGTADSQKIDDLEAQIASKNNTIPHLTRR